jgi:hypothetical protein
MHPSPPTPGKQLTLFKIVEPSTITEALKTEKVRKVFALELQETVAGVLMIEIHRLLSTY